MKIVSHILPDKHVSEMKDGEIAEITSWTALPDSVVGAIVQRYTDKLVRLGCSGDKSWPSAFSDGGYGGISRDRCPECRVRILTPGTIIEV